MCLLSLKFKNLLRYFFMNVVNGLVIVLKLIIIACIIVHLL